MSNELWVARDEECDTEMIFTIEPEKYDGEYYCDSTNSECLCLHPNQYLGLAPGECVPVCIIRKEELDELRDCLQWQAVMDRAQKILKGGN